MSPVRLSLVLACAVALGPSQAQTQPKAVIGGRVVSQPSGEPIRRVSLTLRRDDGEFFRTLSNAQGDFVFAQVEPGEYRLFAERSGFLPQEYGARGPSYRGTPLSLTPGGELTGLVFRLTPHGVLTGRVLDEEGEPVEGAEVTALRRVGVGSPRVAVPIQSGTTNDLGEFRIPGLLPGSYLLMAEAPSLLLATGAAEQYATTFLPGVTEVSAAAPLVVASGRETPSVIQLRKTRVFRVSGVAVDGSGEAVPAGVQLNLVPKDPAQASMALSTPGTLTASGGAFRIENVPEGEYLLTAFRMAGGRRSIGRLPLTVAGRDLEDIRLVAGPSTRVSGVVRSEDENAELKGAVIRLVPAEGPPIGGLSAAAMADGTFVCEGVPAGRYLLDIRALPEQAYVKSLRSGGRDILDQGLDVPQSGEVAVEILLGTNAATVEGQVTDGDHPAAGVTVAIAPDPLRPRQPFLYRSAATGATGRFRMAGLAPGDYRLYAYEEEAGTGPGLDPWLVQPPAESQKITLTGNGTQAVSLPLLTPDAARR